jgi:hypothetical protein
LLEKLNKVGKEPSIACKVVSEIDKFAFKKLALGLDEWKIKLRAHRDEEPQQGIHLKIENRVYYANIEENSHPRDEEIEWQLSKEKFELRKARARTEEEKVITPKELEDLEAQIREQTRDYNKSARATKPNWVVLRRTAF